MTMNNSAINVSINVPTYNGQLHFKTATALLTHGAQRFDISFSSISLLAYNFNHLFAKAYNEMESKGFTHFCLLHADIGPEIGWLARMLSMMKEHRLDCLSLVSPIKNAEFNTSCALDYPGELKKLSSSDISLLPDVFTGSDCKKVFGTDRLLVNTGCMVIDMRRVNPVKCFFEISDRIVRDKNGKYECQNIPEDWAISRKFMKHKIRYAATKSVKLTHHGAWTWDNQMMPRVKGDN